MHNHLCNTPAEGRRVVTLTQSFQAFQSLLWVFLFSKPLQRFKSPSSTIAWMVNCLRALYFLDPWSEFWLLWENTDHSTSHFVLKYIKGLWTTCVLGTQRGHWACSTAMWCLTKQKAINISGASLQRLSTKHREHCHDRSFWCQWSLQIFFSPRTGEKRNFWTTLKAETTLMTGTHFTACQLNAVSAQEEEIQQR